MNEIIATVIIVTRNSSALLEKCINKIKKQKFNQSKLEILVLDGSSTDDTKKISNEYKVNYIDGKYPDNQEARRYIGSKIAKGKYLIFLDTDNFIEDENWISKMINPLFENRADCSFTKWYEWNKNITILDRYYALIGGNDPVAYYLNKNDRAKHLSKKLPLGARLIKIIDNVEFVEFNPKYMAAIGCNGFVIKAELIKKITLEDPNLYFHTDIHVDLMQKIKVVYAIVPITLTHAAGTSIFKSMKKRITYKGVYENKQKRRYLVFDIHNKKDLWNLVKLITKCIFILPLVTDSIVGIIKTRKFEWILHPLITISMVIGYSIDVLRRIKFEKLQN